MSIFPLPPHSLPAPYSCSEPGSFAEATLLNRLPAIARRIIAENDFPETVKQRLLSLIAELPDGKIQDLDDHNSPDIGLWRDYLKPFLGLTWHDLSFLVCENTFYRQVLAATGYFQPGRTWHQDPYAYQKRLGLTVSRTGVQALAGRLNGWLKADFPAVEALSAAIENNLWGNRADLSLWPADARETLPNSQLLQAAEFLLVNDLSELVTILLNLPGKQRRVDFLIDNAGYELVCDLALADLMLGRNWVDQVCFHLKAHPTFVSDALAADVQDTVEFLKSDSEPGISAFGERIARTLAKGNLLLEEHFFWNSPLATWEMPETLRKRLGEAGLVISKGDAHYRRLVGDRRWLETTSFASVQGYFPTRLAALRTSKSDVIVGLRPGQVLELDRIEPAWRTNGRWGLVQVKS